MIQLPVDQLKKLVVDGGIVDEKAFAEAVDEAIRLKQNIAEVIISKNAILPSYLYQAVAAYFNVPLADLAGKQIAEEILRLIPEQVARQKRAILFKREEDGSIGVAMEDPANLETMEFLERFLNSKVKPYLAMDADLNKGFALYGLRQSEDFRKLIEKNVADSLKLGKRGEEAAADVPIIEIVNNLVEYAVSLRASDIHLEVFEDVILTRYRIDGILQEIMRLPKAVQPAITARIKLLAGLKIDEHYRPQDGRFRQKIGPDMIDVRVSIIPTSYGEKIEMRLLTAAQRPLTLEELGMSDEMAKSLTDDIRKSYGMVLVCGPTGSGKTTTLYSVMSLLNNPGVNIVTIEDPIEYNMKYVNQTQVNPAAGVTFATGLRAILRQDPNIIMVGEIRDADTAGISVQAALTGHMVLSSLHTNDASTAIPRLIDMAVQPFLVAAVLNAAISQRLVRRICPDCIYSYEVQPEIAALVEKQLAELGVKDRKAPKFAYAGKGCSSCGGTGYRGRIGIYEILNINEEERREIIKPIFSLDDLRTIAKKAGMKSIFEDGVDKVVKGVTTIDELLRAVRE
jgi:type IV pilus assembly protein PilB